MDRLSFSYKNNFFQPRLPETPEALRLKFAKSEWESKYLDVFKHLIFIACSASRRYGIAILTDSEIPHFMPHCFFATLALEIIFLSELEPFVVERYKVILRKL